MTSRFREFVNEAVEAQIKKMLNEVSNFGEPQFFEVGDYVKTVNQPMMAGKVVKKNPIEKHNTCEYVIEYPAVSRQYLERPNLNISDKDGMYYVLTTAHTRKYHGALAPATQEDIDAYTEQLKQKYNAKSQEEIASIYQDLENKKVMANW